MRFQPRRFVVEVKRGTSRGTFVSHQDGADRSVGPQALPFDDGSAAPATRTTASVAKPSGRVLPALDAPEPIELPVAEPVRRRGRPPGTKNKPKAAVPGSSASGLSARAFDGAAEPHREIRVTAPRTDHERKGVPASEGKRQQAAGPPAEPGAATGQGESARSRLRARSRILRRFVLRTEPRAGERGSLRARKMNRGSRRPGDA